MQPIRLLLVTDAWPPQINGVVRSLQRMVSMLEAWGDRVTVISPAEFRTMGCPTYPEIRLSLTWPSRVGRMIEQSDPEFVHIATEGPLGLMARRHCMKSGRSYTTSYHTKFPEYVTARVPVPIGWLYGFMRRFHNGGVGCMVATRSLEDELRSRGFRRLMRWSRGVDAALFRPMTGSDSQLPRPVFLSVGRVAVEKNLEAFLSLDLPGSKLVVGDGPALEMLKKKYPDVHFAGAKEGEDLSRAYAAADVFVFPSLTDTFGNVILEALASGLPVAAFPVTGPKDILVEPGIGALDDDLRAACLRALELGGEKARQFALRLSWEESARTFRANIIEANSQPLPEAA
ncbi:MAG TPA: glycosyltransferase family 1 protein [Afifellaceae bacterium]|nr:glycosyltransferase family 1 protein [Afifellaceae bacterium]